MKVRSFSRNTINSAVFTRKTSWRKLFSSLVTSLKSLPAILSTTDSSTEFPSHGFYKVALFKISEDFLWDIFVIPFSNKVAGLQLGFNFTKKCFWQKYMELTFDSKGDLNSVLYTGNLYIKIKFIFQYRRPCLSGWKYHETKSISNLGPKIWDLEPSNLK